MIATPVLHSVPVSAQVARPLEASTPLRSAPGGPVVARIGVRTSFGSPLVLAVAARRGGWAGVLSPALPNGELGWVPVRDVRLAPVAYRIVVELSRHDVVLERGGRVVRTMTAGVGSPLSPTPTGQFAVTDKLAGNAAYGCCILALSGHQTKPPPGWQGGTRLAIHGGATGGATSAGCIHLDESDLRYLMRVVPLGTIVTVSAG
jgi:lipoprotein-anchoring transpeptidase ErfK/SrfK